MEFIAFKPIIFGPTVLESAMAVNGYTNATWIERYRESGEFKFVAPLSSGLRDVLPLGTLVSHMNTTDLMFVEAHIITEEQGKDSTIEISGRSFDAFLENRVIGMHRDWDASSETVNFVMPSDYSYEQAKDLIVMTIDTGPNFQFEERIPNVTSITDISGTFTPAAPAERIIERGTLFQRVRELLAVDDLGLKVVRRNPFGIEPGDPNYTLLVVHNGKDKRDTVIFSSKMGDIESAEYLWTNKTLRNAALVTGRWLETRVNNTSPVAEGYDRRVVYISATDIDQGYESVPIGVSVLNQLAARGLTLLADKRQFLITRADISKRTRYQYRRDYGIGDIVTVQSNYGDVMPMRIVEFTEIEDETGESGHPTLGVYDY